MTTILFYVCIIILAVLNYGISESFFKRKTQQYYVNQKCEVVLIKKQFHQQAFISVIFEIISYFILLVPLATVTVAQTRDSTTEFTNLVHVILSPCLLVLLMY